MENLCGWINENPEEYHPVILSAIAHYNMVRIHPFQDGNGRGARLLMNIILMREQYHPAIIEVEQRKQYLESLKQGDKKVLIPFIEIVINAIKKTQHMILSETKDYIAKPSTSLGAINKY